MTYLTDKLKVTRGKGYYTVLKAVLKECGQQIVDDAEKLKVSRPGRSLLDLLEVK